MIERKKMDLDAFPVLKERFLFTEAKLKLIRQELLSILNGKNLCLISTGSYGRKEASESSDLDMFIVTINNEKINDDVLEKIKEVISKHVKNDAGDTGTFGTDASVSLENFLKIGGSEETNKGFTRRILFLLEGTWIYNETLFQEIRERLLEKYIKETDSDKNLSMFFLNDIIRYYRTIATDFEHKVSEGNKSWGLRNIKLRFSRKLLYFGGIITVAEAYGIPGNKSKIKKVAELLDLSVLERISAVGKDKDLTDKLLLHYESFLKSISNGKNRDELENTTKQNREKENTLYYELGEEGKKFSKILEAWLRKQYNEEHLIHHSLIF